MVSTSMRAKTEFSGLGKAQCVRNFNHRKIIVIKYYHRLRDPKLIMSNWHIKVQRRNTQSWRHKRRLPSFLAWGSVVFWQHKLGNMKIRISKKTKFRWIYCCTTRLPRKFCWATTTIWISNNGSIGVLWSMN